mmetsp:Transcript_147356/g.410508  ORF Transcript_147356/g.410508 Transcript_147356/m.410508 type:complete len:796 (+) Transcript_147356:3-2390(+)
MPLPGHCAAANICRAEAECNMPIPSPGERDPLVGPAIFWPCGRGASVPPLPEQGASCRAARSVDKELPLAFGMQELPEAPCRSHGLHEPLGVELGPRLLAMDEKLDRLMAQVGSCLDAIGGLPRPLQQAPVEPQSRGSQEDKGEPQAEILRLRRRNSELSRENAEFRAAAPATPSVAAAVAMAAAAAGTSAEVSAECSAWRVKLQAQSGSSRLDDPPKSKCSSRSKNGSVHLHNLEGQFQRFAGVGNGGRIYPQDLLDVVQCHGSPDECKSLVEGEGLMDVFRYFDSANKLSDQPCRHRESADDMPSMDFQGFAHLMNHGISNGNTTGNPDLERGIKSIQQACVTEANTHLVGSLVSYVSEGGDSRDDSDGPKLTGWRAWCVETLPTAIILVNTFVIGLSSDIDPLNDVWIVFERFFLAFYTLEIVMKVWLFGCSNFLSGPQRTWNLFDCFCLAISYGDLAVTFAIGIFYQGKDNPDLSSLALIKIFRLARLARLLRTLRFKIFYELKLMIMGVLSGLRVLTWAIVLLFTLTYLLGVAMRNLIGNYEEEFETVPASMFTLFRCWTDGCAAYDGTPLSERLRWEYGGLYFVGHILVTMFVTVGVFNLIMAIFIDNVVSSQANRKQRELGEKGPEVEQRLRELFTTLIYQRRRERGPGGERNSIVGRALQQLDRLSDRSGPGLRRGWSEPCFTFEQLEKQNVSITRKEFNQWIEHPAFLELLEDAEIDSANRHELFDVLDADMDGKLRMSELITGLMKLRGPVTKSDIVAMRLKVRYLAGLLESLVPGSQRRTAAVQ